MTDALARKRMVGYSDRISARPGQQLQFMVSCDGPLEYRAQIVRLICGDRHPGGLGFIEEPIKTELERQYTGRFQPLLAGSYAVIEERAHFKNLRSFTLQAMIWPTTPGAGRQVIMGRWDAAAGRGFALTLDDRGALAVEVGDGSRVDVFSTEIPLTPREWAFVAASFDGASRRVRLYHEPAGTRARQATVRPREQIFSVPVAADEETPFAIAAATMRDEHGETIGCSHFNGKIERPVLCAEAIDRTEMEALRHGSSPRGVSIVASWDFSQDMTTDRIVDTGPLGNHGRLINLPTRAMKGHNWTGEVFDWKAAPSQYGAIHFHDDDLYDARWQADFSLTVPQGLRSGVYAAKLTSQGQAEYIPFVVLPERGASTAHALVLLPTVSYMAYANERIALEGGARIHAFTNHMAALEAENMWLNEHPEVGGSLYDHHADGSGVCYSSRLRPIINFRPGITSGWVGPAGTAPWQFNADLALVGWLEAKGIAYDVITDEDLHEEGYPLVARYKAVLTGSHPEYYSKAMYDAIVHYLDSGGRLMYLGGNGFYWRVAFHQDLPGVIELRRAEDGIRDWVAEGGEYFHSFTGEYGGMWSRMGRPIHALVGIGMAAQGFDVSSYYRRKPDSRSPRAEFVFEGITEEIIGDFGTVGGGAAGLELDRYDSAQGSPLHALVLASSEDHSDTYFPPPDEIHNATAMMDGRQNPNIRSDMVFFETSSGGAVFSTGSIAWIGSLSHNNCSNNVSRITENVLRRFIDPTPFTMP